MHGRIPFNAIEFLCFAGGLHMQKNKKLPKKDVCCLQKTNTCVVFFTNYVLDISTKEKKKRKFWNSLFCGYEIPPPMFNFWQFCPHSWPENVKSPDKKKLVKSNKSISRFFFLTKFHFLQFQKCPKINFWTGKKY